MDQNSDLIVLPIEYEMPEFPRDKRVIMKLQKTKSDKLLVFIDYKEMKQSLSKIFQKITENSIKSVSFDSEKKGFERG